MDQAKYNEEVVKREKKQPKNASRRCQAILKPLMLRRNKDTELNGKRILELPEKTVNMAWQDFELDVSLCRNIRLTCRSAQSTRRSSSAPRCACPSSWLRAR